MARQSRWFQVLYYHVFVWRQDFFSGYTDIKTNELIEYVISDGRKVQILFEALNDETHITETFEAEEVHPTELQQDGWQAILNNFKRYTETH